MSSVSPSSLRRCAPKEAPRFMASKWLSYHLLLDSFEWNALFRLPSLCGMEMFRSSGLFLPEDMQVVPDQFLEHWREYETQLTRNGRATIDDRLFRPHFSLYMTLSREAVVAISSGFKKEMIQPVQPCVTMQLHRFHASIEPQVKILTGVFGPHAISWGVSVSYPQIVQDGSTRTIQYALKDEQCVNRSIWRAIQRFIREHTHPTPLVINDQKIWAPIRIGHRALSWIEKHIELTSSSSRIAIDVDRCRALQSRASLDWTALEGRDEQ